LPHEFTFLQNGLNTGPADRQKNVKTRRAARPEFRLRRFAEIRRRWPLLKSKFQRNFNGWNRFKFVFGVKLPSARFRPLGRPLFAPHGVTRHILTASTEAPENARRMKSRFCKTD